MKDPHAWELLLDRYVAGECDAAEETEILKAFAEHSEDRAVLEAVRAARAREAQKQSQLPPSDAPSKQTVAAFERLEQRLAKRGTGPMVGPRLALEQPGGPTRVLGIVPSTRWTQPARARGTWAAGITVLLVAGGVGSWLTLHGRMPAGSAYREYATARGQRAVVRLLDGTAVTMNVGSRLRVPTTFGTKRGDLELDGEAYFAVVHDPARPFAVRTARGVVRDAGTQFDVRAYAGEARQRVVIAEGEVAIDGTSLHAGDAALLADTTHVVVTHHADVTSATAWMRGRLEFTDESLSEALARLGRWYDLDVRLADPALGAERVTGSYGDEPVSQVLTLLTAAVGARYEWHGRTVTVRAAR